MRFVEQVARPQRHGERLTEVGHRNVGEREATMQIDKAAYFARYQGRRIALALNEFRLLIHLVEYPSRVFTRNSLIDILHKADERIDERTVDSVGYVLHHVDSEILTMMG